MMEGFKMTIMENFMLKGKKALVTGAGRGIGKSIAKGFAQAGADVAILDINKKDVSMVAKNLEEYGIRVIAIEADVSNADDVEEVFKKVLNDFSTIDIVFNNAGINNTDTALDVSIGDWKRVIDVNLTGVFQIAREAGKIMVKKKSGSIINMGSMSGHIICHPQSQSAYNSSKAGVIHLTKSLASEWAGYNVRVNSISPGFTSTEMVKTFPKELIDSWKKIIPLGRLCKVEELQGIAIFLASDASSYITGEDIKIDGGYTVR